MTISNEDPDNIYQRSLYTDLKTKLKELIITDFDKRLNQSDIISEEQRRQLHEMLTKDTISASDIIVALNIKE